MSSRRLTLIAGLASFLVNLGPPAASASPEFFRAVRADNLAEVGLILANGVASNVLNASLYHAVSGEMASMLLAAGADHDAPIRDGLNAMHWAVLDGKPDVLRALLDDGGDFNTTTPGHRNSLLHLTVWRTSRATLETAQMVVSAGTDVEAVTPYGATALHFMAKYGQDPAKLDLLLDTGANPLARLTYSRRGDAGKTPLDLARKYNPRILRSDAGRRLQAATRRVGMDEPGCDGVVVQPSDKKLSWLAERTLGRASRWREIVELNSLEGRGYRAGQCLKLPA